MISGAQADSELRQIEQIQALLKLVPQANAATLFAAGAVAIACLVVASLLWAIRPPTHVQMDVTTESVTLKLAGPLSWSGAWKMTSGLVRLEEMSLIEVPPELGAAANLLSGRAWLEISKGNLDLKHLELPPGAELSIRKEESQTLKITFQNASLLGQLGMYGTPAVEGGQSPEQTEKLASPHFDMPALITFYSDAVQAPAVLDVTPRNELELIDLPVQSISFAREAADSDMLFRSGIMKGKLTIVSTGEEVPLDAGSRLRFEIVHGIISKLSIGSGGSTFTFDGMVRKASIGPLGFARKLGPSLLENLYHQERLGFFWAAVSFLWGVLWSARTLIFR